MKTKTTTKKAPSATRIVFFDSEADADARMRSLNRTANMNARHPEIFCVVDGPEDNFAVVDLATAIELGGGYRWAI
jgi:hypothetical protein